MKNPPHYDKIVILKGSSNSSLKEAAMAVDDVLAGRTLESLDQKMEKIREEIMAYVDKNIDNIK